MKLFFAISLITVHIFNIGGYRLLFHFFSEKADKQMVKQLDMDFYEEKDLITIKVPLNLPYSSHNWQEFERFDGSIELEGIHYNYVKRKVYNDTLILLCTPNHIKQKLREVKDELAKMNGDARSSHESKNGLNLVEKSWVKEFNYTHQGYAFCSLSAKQTGYSLINDHSVYTSFILIPELPPKMS